MTMEQGRRLLLLERRVDELVSEMASLRALVVRAIVHLMGDELEEEAPKIRARIDAHLEQRARQ